MTTTGNMDVYDETHESLSFKVKAPTEIMSLSVLRMSHDVSNYVSTLTFTDCTGDETSSSQRGS